MDDLLHRPDTPSVPAGSGTSRMSRHGSMPRLSSRMSEVRSKALLESVVIDTRREEYDRIVSAEREGTRDGTDGQNAEELRD